jgi:hypothetical protein
MWRVQFRADALEGERWRRYAYTIDRQELDEALLALAKRFGELSRPTDIMQLAKEPVVLMAQLEVVYVLD